MQESEFYNIASVAHTHWWYVGMSAIAADWLRRLPGRTIPNPSGRLLDAGCGTGSAFQWLAEFGRPFGVDRHPLALHLATNNGCPRLIRADVCALPFAEGSFSILTSFDVLYHKNVTDDRGVLREFARVLQPGGWLLLRLPAHNWLRGAHDHTVQTRYRYTRHEVQAKLAAAGLYPVRVTYVNALLFLPTASWRLLQRCLGVRAASDVRLPPRLLNSILKAVLGAERAWLRRFNLPVGLSVLALARKEIA
jgi:SAM-dependent methyltransferase